MQIISYSIEQCLIYYSMIKLYSFTHKSVNMDNKFCSPLTYQHFNDLNYCPNPQCNNIKKGIICLNSNADTNIVTKYDWAVKSLCEKCNCTWYLCKLCSNLKSPLKSKTSVYNHHYRYHQSNNNSVNSMFNNDLNTNNKSPNQPKCSKRKKTQHYSSDISSLPMCQPHCHIGF